MSKQLRLIFLCCCFSASHSSAQSWSQKMAATVMTIWKDSLEMAPGRPVKWAYDQGVVLEGIEGLWTRTADNRYFEYIQKSMDYFVQEDGTIRTYKPDEYNIDHVKNGRSLLLLYKVTGKPKYLKVVQSLRQQLRTHPRTSEGGFWHKKIYPYQMWLDGLYMGEPFYAEYAALFHEDTAFSDIARQFILMERHARDNKTGLLYHGWDESRQQRWANKSTGLSPNFWDRAMGWFGMGLVDVLDYFPQNHPKRDTLIAILNRMAAAVQKYQDSKTGVWFQVMDKATSKGNYVEASGSCMFVYALAKGVRNAYLPQSYLNVARKGYNGIIKEFMETDAGGLTNLKGTVSVAGLGGTPYRDGSYEYYLSEKVIVNDPKGVGAFLLASNEMEIADMPKSGKGKTVMLDNYFNNEKVKNDISAAEPFHYLWDEKDNNGFYLLGQVFRYRGASINTLKVAPDAGNLKNADIYIIVDPDSKKETADPKYVEAGHIKAITDWVKAGGTLLLLGNDSGNMEFEHFNKLAEAFGIHFNEDSKNRVPGSEYRYGKIVVPSGHPVFKTARQLYMKEVSSLTLKSPAKSVLDHKGDVFIAVAKSGKGTVIAVGDPWLYNEYTDGRKLHAEYENFKAAEDLAEWLFKQ